MKRHEALSTLERELSVKYSQVSARKVALLLLCWALDISHAELISYDEVLLSPEELTKLMNALKDNLLSDKPLAYIIGTVPFLFATLKVRPPVLIPRPETELMTDFAIKELKKLGRREMKILDLCTGSGCIAISLAQAFAKADIYACDISEPALELAKENASDNMCHTITFIQSDLFAQLPSMTFDMIISNPPYVSTSQWENMDPGITQWEDPQAFLAGEDGLNIIKNIISQAPAWLTHEKNRDDQKVPQLIIECAEYHAHDVVSLMEQAGFKAICHQDDAGKDRYVTGILTKDMLG